MLHKAFEFDTEKFNVEFQTLLVSSLESDNIDQLRKFINENIDRIKDPYEGEPVDKLWEDTLEVRDVQEYADHALTKYYDPDDDYGLSDDWVEIDDMLDRNARLAILGDSIRGGASSFDPGRMGSYFQTKAQIERSIIVLESNGHEELIEYIKFLKKCLKNNKGIYVTF
ncbi:MAG: hypothetical protein ACC657_17955 [Thiohalomonadales bacterium]